jgi:hypothetical protein
MSAEHDFCMQRANELDEIGFTPRTSLRFDVDHETMLLRGGVPALPGTPSHWHGRAMRPGKPQRSGLTVVRHLTWNVALKYRAMKYIL